MEHIGKIFAGLATFISLWAGGITIVDKHGAQLQGFMLWTAENSWWILPIACFFLGICIGRFFRKKQPSKSASNANNTSKQNTLNDLEKKFKEEPCGEKKAIAAYIFQLPDHKAIISDNGVSRLQEMDLCYSNHPDRYVFYRFDARGGNTTYIELEKWLISLFSAKPELLEEFPKKSITDVESFFDYYDPTIG